MINAFFCRTTFLTSIWGILMLPLTLIYLIGFNIKRLLTRKYIVPNSISVGNITSGGTGKTPLSVYLGEKFNNPLIVSRGYGGNFSGIITGGKCSRAELSDETLIYMNNLPDVPLIIGKKRIARLMGYLAGKEIKYTVIADDAMQHFPLIAQCNIVLLKGNCPFGNGFILPGGMLREPMKALSRADIILINTEAGDLKTSARKRIERFGLPIFKFGYKLQGIFDRSGEKAAQIPSEYCLLSAIASPGSLEATLSKKGMKATRFLTFTDHHRFSASDIKKISLAATEIPVVTSEKDIVKISDNINNLYYAKIRCNFEKEDLFLTEIRNKLESNNN